MKYFPIKICITFYLAIFSSSSLANTTHQFSVNFSKDWIEYIEGNASSYYMNATAYFTPVKKSAALPYARTAFYSRTSSASVSANKTKWDDLSSVVGGRVLQKMETKNYSISTFLAHKDLPIWSQLSYRYLDNTSAYFSSDTKSVSDTDSIKDIALGVYILDHLSINGFFSKQKDKTYGIGLSKLFNLAEFGFIETNLSYAITHREKIETNITNNVVRNLDIAARSEKNRYLRISYYPTPQTRLSIAYQQIDYDQYDWKDSYSEASIQHYFTKMLHTTLSYTHKEAYFFDYLGEYNDIGLSLGFDF